MKHFYQNISGFSSFKEQGCLLHLVLHNLPEIQKLKIAEVGVYQGRGTAIWVVELLNKNLDFEYTAIDHFMGSSEHDPEFGYYEATKNNLKPIDRFVKIMNQTSFEAAQNFDEESLDLIYIDASHDYDSVLNDLKSWFPKLKKGGIICGDDYIDGWPGVVSAVDEFFDSKINKFGIQQWWTIK
jgi:predicted O-methyltransferase YrrM